MKYIAIGIKKKSEALKEKRKAINSGFKGIKIIPFTSYGSKRPYHYDITYTSVNPLIKKVKETKCKKIISYTRRTPKGMKKLGRDIIYKC